ncbi:hypothetical protein [Microbacterium sp. NPDC089695]|uniref:hypothetical protein n=1 Tax=Microbacterium sp. NPDC089695 TaxID=3364198 RepID=UPI00380078CA
MLHRRPPLLALAALAVVGTLAGCAASPAPTPTPTPAFASDEEAFAAAEEVYRAYNDAGNARNAGEPEPNPQDFLVGNALEGDIEGVRLLEEGQLTVDGEVKVDSVALEEAPVRSQQTKVVVLVCLDVSQVRLMDANGNDVTPRGRADVVAQEVTFTSDGDDLRISSEASADVSQC